jgi:hypothetical protein
MRGQQMLAAVLVFGILLGPEAGPVVPPADGAGQPRQAEAVHGDVDADWWSTVQENIRRSEYQITWQEQTYLADVPAAYQAPNRAHNLRTYFSPDGPIVIPRV